MRLKKFKFGYTLPVRIMGKVYRFLIDTGAQKSIIKADVVNCCVLPLQVNPQEISNSMKQKMVVSYSCSVPISIENDFTETVNMLVLNKSFVFNGLKCQGILGTDVLCKLDFKLTFKNNRFDILRVNEEASDPFFSLFVNGKKCTAIIDTAASNSWICENSILCKDCDYHVRPVLFFSIDSVRLQLVKIYKRVSMDTGNYKAMIQNVHVGRSVSRKGHAIDIVLGRDVLKRAVLMFVNSSYVIIPV